MTTPLLPADYLDLVSPLRAGADLRGRIVAVHPETRDAVTLVIRPGRGWAGHVPGPVRPHRRRRRRRPPVARLLADLTGDRADGCIAITVKAIPDGRVSNHLVRRARAGTLVHLDQACGEFVLPDPRPAKVLFVTAGSGITPGDGDAAQLPSTSSPTSSSSHSAPTGGRRRSSAASCACWRGAGASRLVERHTDTDGMLELAQLADLVGDLDERETWACGPAGMLDALESRWADDGVEDRLHTERFRPTVLAAGEGGTVTFTRERGRASTPTAPPRCWTRARAPAC